jgi:small subunit ribosomal protein S17
MRIKKMKKKGIGLEGVKTDKTCSDKNCPFHGNLTVRGRILTGTVTSDKMSKTVIVAWARRVYVPKYERYEKRRSSVKAHNPSCINAKKGDLVRISESRPLSKTKHFVIVEILGEQSKEQAVKDDLMQESSVEAASRITADDKKKKKPSQLDDGSEDQKESRKSRSEE